MIKLVGLFPRHLNLNGDFGNIEVLRQRAIWLGFQVETALVEPGESIPTDADFVLVGHGSKAAWQSLQESLPVTLDTLKRPEFDSCHLLAVASGYEKCIEAGIFQGSLEPTERISKFEIVELPGEKVLGYKNSISSCDDYQVRGLKVGTQLHGPLFAKNPQIADRIINAIAQKKSLLPKSNQRNQKQLDRVNNLVGAVWALETELARE